MKLSGSTDLSKNQHKNEGRLKTLCKAVILDRLLHFSPSWKTDADEMLSAWMHTGIPFNSFLNAVLEVSTVCFQQSNLYTVNLA